MTEWNKIKGRNIDLKEFLSRQYSYDINRISLERDIDTALLPIQITGTRLSDHSPIPKVGGGITTIGNTVLILDRLGSIYSCTPAGDVKKLDLPPLPNNISAYVGAGGAVESKSFRAYSIKYLSALRLLVASHESFDSERMTTRMAVSVIGIDEASLRPIGSWRTIFTSDPEPDAPNDTGGGRLAVDQGKIYLTIGVYDVEQSKASQDAQSTFGKIFEISPITKKARMLSMGHRNPQGLAITKTGELWSTEHGPAGGDELNLIVEGANYGWPNVTLGTNYNKFVWADDGNIGRHRGYQLPIFAWVPSVAVSNLIQIEGFDRRWDGDFLVGSLKGQSLFRLRLDGKRVVYSEPIWIGQRIRDIAQLQNGTIALWTDDTQLLFWTVDHKRLDSNRRLPMSVDDRVTDCMVCHHFGPTNVTDAAPSLSNLFHRRIASDNFRYSSALRSREEVWTEETLRAFLSSPDKFANGTSMPPQNLKPEDIDGIIGFLKGLPE